MVSEICGTCGTVGLHYTHYIRKKIIFLKNIKAMNFPIGICAKKVPQSHTDRKALKILNYFVGLQVPRSPTSSTEGG